MRNLIVGQKVTLQSGDLFHKAFVEAVNEDYVRVFIPPWGPFMPNEPPLGEVEIPYSSPDRKYGYAIEFRYDGTQRGVWGWVDAWDPRPLCTKFGPWRLVER